MDIFMEHQWNINGIVLGYLLVSTTVPSSKHTKSYGNPVRNSSWNGGFSIAMFVCGKIIIPSPCLLFSEVERPDASHCRILEMGFSTICTGNFPNSVGEPATLLQNMAESFMLQAFFRRNVYVLCPSVKKWQDKNHPSSAYHLPSWKKGVTYLLIFSIIAQKKHLNPKPVMNCDHPSSPIPAKYLCDWDPKSWIDPIEFRLGVFNSMDWYIYRKPRFLLSSTGVVCELLSWIPCPTVGSHVKSLGKSTSIPNQRIISNMPSISIFIVYWAKPRDCWFTNLHPYKSPCIKLSHLFLVLPPPLFMAQSPRCHVSPQSCCFVPHLYPSISRWIRQKHVFWSIFDAESQTCGNCPIISHLFLVIHPIPSISHGPLIPPMFSRFSWSKSTAFPNGRTTCQAARSASARHHPRRCTRWRAPNGWPVTWLKAGW